MVGLGAAIPALAGVAQASWGSQSGAAAEKANKAKDAVKEESVDGYAEWRASGALIVDGQRLVPAREMKFKGSGDAKSFASIPLGYEVKAKGRRLPDGRLWAEQIEAKPNGDALFEGELKKAFDEMEEQFVNEGRMYEEDEAGKRDEYGRLDTDGPEVDRVRHILRSLIPAYLNPDDFRIYIIRNKEWNALAAPNRSIYVFNGLLKDLNDDEVAIVLGHELAHSTHEHSRKGFKKDMIIQLAALGVAVLADETIEGDGKAAAVGVAALVGALAWQNGYGRSQEDQADRVGLRYAFEAGYDVGQGPTLWDRFAKKYGDLPKALNFFLGSHSVAKDRARNLRRELDLNYRDRAR
jgi:Zn-dependent protease with chaperone function